MFSENKIVKKIINEKTTSIYGVSDVDNTGQELHMVFSISKADEAKLKDDSFDIYENTNILLLGTGPLPENIVQIVEDLYKKSN